MPRRRLWPLNWLLLLSLVTSLALGLGPAPRVPPALASGARDADGGSGNWRHLNTNTESDMGSNRVRAIGFERDGDGIPRLWIGTDQGLQSFNGRSWETVPLEPGPESQPTTETPSVTALAHDGQGNLWIGTPQALVRRDAEGSQQRWPSDGDVDLVTPLQGGRLLVVTTLKGTAQLSLFDPPQETWVRLDLNVDQIHDVSVTEQAIWLATSSGAVPLDPRTFAPRVQQIIEPQRVGLSDDVRTLAVQGDGTLWIGTADGLVRVPAGGRDAPATWEPFRSDRPGLAGAPVNDLLIDPDGILWVATEGGGLSTYDLVRGRWDRYFQAPGGLLSNRVRRLLLDDQGVLWAVTDAGISGLDFSWHTITPANTVPTDDVGANDVRALWGAADGVLWVGTGGGGVSLSDDDGATWLTFNSTNSGLFDDRVFSLWGDRRDTVWIGTESGLAFWTGSGITGTVARAHDSLPAGPIYALWGSERGPIWVGAQNGLFYSVGSLDEPADLTWERYSPAPGRFPQPSDAPRPAIVVRALWGDGDGTLWVGTNDGLWRVQDDAIQEINTTDLPDNDIHALWGDADGRLWVGTRRGLGRPDPAAEDRWIPVTSASTGGALPADLIRALWIDDQGQVWAGTQAGLAVSADGETWQTVLPGAIAALWGDPSGQLWAGGPNKLAHRPSRQAGWRDELSADRGLRSRSIADLVLDPESEMLWAATPAGLTSSQDRGLTWHTDLSLVGAQTLYRTDDGRLWAGGSFGLARSENGSDWERFDLTTPGVTAVATGSLEIGALNAIWVDESQAPGVIWLGTERGLYRSDDDGTTWTPRLEGRSISALDGQGETVWAGTTNGELLQTRNGGQTWRDVDEVVGETIYDLWVRDDQILVATARGLHRSDDGGTRWRLFNTDEGLPGDTVTALHVDPNGGQIWLTTLDGGLAFSRDDGTSWHVINTPAGLDNETVQALLSVKGEERLLWLATSNGLARYAPRDDVRPWVRLLQISDGERTFDNPQAKIDLVSDQELQVQLEGGSLIAPPTQVRYTALLSSRDDATASFSRSADPASAGNVVRFAFFEDQANQLEGNYDLSVTAVDADGRESPSRRLVIIAPATTGERILRWLGRVMATLFLPAFLIGFVLVIFAAWLVVWSLSRSIGIPRRVLLRQGARIPIVGLGYRDYRHRWENATPLERLLLLLAPDERPFTQAEAADWLQERAIPAEEQTLERTLEAAVRDDLLRRRGNRYSVTDRALNRALQDHEGDAGLEELMRQVRDTHPLVAEAHNLFKAAGFTLQDAAHPLSFFCQPAISFWTRRLEESVYTRVLPGVPLDRQAVHDLHRDARAKPGAGPIALVVIDTHPDDSGWDAIGELRGAGFAVIPIDDRLIQNWQAQKREQHELAEHLDRFLDPDYDPYVALPATSGALGYFGHRKLAQTLLKRLEQGQPIALIGLRKMGTSSTLRYLQDQARWPAALVDLQASPDLPATLTSALQDWVRSARRDLKLELSPPEGPPAGLSVLGQVSAGAGSDFTTEFTATVQHLVQKLRVETRAPSARLIFLLDEIELLTPEPDGSGPNLARYLTLTRLLKGLVQDGALSLMVAASDPQFNRTSLFGEQANPLYQLFQEQFLPPLSPQECGHMVRNIGRQVGLTYDQETLDFIAEASGGHPYLARQLCSLAYRDLGRAGPVPLDVVRQAAERFVRNPRTAAFLDDNGLWGYFGQPDLWGLLGGRANQAVLIDLAAAPQPMTARELKEGPNPQARASAIYGLRELWVIRPVDPDASPLRYEITFGLFRDWIALNRDKESPKLQLQQHAQEFFTNGGFTVRPLESEGYTPWDFLSIPMGTGWRARFGQALYTAIVARQPLDDQAVRAIHEAALTHSPGSGVAFAVIDERPDDTAWLQIATLHARGFSLVLLPQTLLQDGRASQKERRLLHNHLNRALGRGHNPYDVRSPVYDVLNFFGRQALSDQMTARLTAIQPLALFGLRKMGKSSMLYYLRNRVPFPVALVDLQSETSPRAIYHEILRGWSRSLYIKFSFEWPVPILPESDRDLPAVFRDITNNLLETLAQLMPAPKLGIFLDEIEQIVPRSAQAEEKLTQYLAFMRGLRGILQESKQLAVLIAGVDPAINRVSRYGDEQNPAYQLFQEIFLPPLTPEDCGQMVRNIGRQVGLRFPQTTIDVVNEASGGHPFLARQLCSRAYNELDRTGQINAPVLRETVDTFIRNPQTAANLDERGMWGEVTRPALWEPGVAEANAWVLRQLAAAPGPLEKEAIVGEKAPEALEDAFFALQNRWVISKIKQRRGPSLYEITYGLFYRWIRRHFGLEDESDTA